MVMVSVPLFLVSLDIPELLPLSLLGLLRDLVSVALMLSPDTLDTMDMPLTLMELMASASFTLLDIPSSMLFVASVVLMLSQDTLDAYYRYGYGYPYAHHGYYGYGRGY